ncbi:MAG: nucleotidyltransferase family protein [Oscillospiraceae bacterium]|nr:nucleotidyltransferase family protein [Oscillospiraceae bacterium]
MNETEKTLLQLTGRALFSTPTDFDPAKVDWASLYQEATNQAVSLLIWDALSDKERALIPDDIAHHWEQDSFRHIMSNEQLLYEQEQVLQAFKEASIPCAILKGSSSAACYPQPSLRVMGDIDILVKPEQQMRAVEALQANGYGDILDEAHHCHMTIHKDSFTVEVHKEPNGMFMNMDAEIGEKLHGFFADAVDRRQIVNGLPFLSDEQQAVVLILHKLEHFMTSGLGLRQLCDWAVFVNARMDEELWEKLRPQLEEFGLLTFTGLMTRVCVDYLGLPEEKAPWAMQYNNETAERVIEQILKEGNFGKKADRYGERLFNDPNSSNRVTSLFKVLGNACREHWPPCEKHAILMPVAPFVLLGRYMIQRRRGERPKLSLKKKYQQAGYDQKLYKELKPFITE